MHALKGIGLRNCCWWLAMLAALVCFNAKTWASGTETGGLGNGAGIGFDLRYEWGRAITAGRVAAYAKVEFCVESAQRWQPLSLHSLRRFTTRSELLSSLYDCASPGMRRLMDVMMPADLEAVVHFLERRHTLRLR